MELIVLFIFVTIYGVSLLVLALIQITSGGVWKLDNDKHNKVQNKRIAFTAVLLFLMLLSDYIYFYQDLLTVSADSDGSMTALKTITMCFIPGIIVYLITRVINIQGPVVKYGKTIIISDADLLFRYGKWSRIAPAEPIIVKFSAEDLPIWMHSLSVTLHFSDDMRKTFYVNWSGWMSNKSENKVVDYRLALGAIIANMFRTGFSAKLKQAEKLESGSNIINQSIVEGLESLRVKFKEDCKIDIKVKKLKYSGVTREFNIRGVFPL